jgi:hypothetical protein
MFNNFFLKNHAIYEMRRKNTVGFERPAYDNMAHIPKATNTYTQTHTEYVILVAFPLQQWLLECTSMLH